jgi:glycosyltransferase involved in cell wall biosynthesis
VKPLRLVLVTRRFWPQVGGAAASLASLAAGLRAAGAQVTIITTRSRPEWPERMEHHGVPVIRLPSIASGRFGPWRHAWKVWRWLSKARQQFDLVCVSGLKHEAFASLIAGDGRFPVVLRPEGAGMSGDVHWQLDAFLGERIKRHCLRASALMAPNPAVHRELIAAGYPRDRCHYFPCGVPLPPPNTPAARQAARKVLGRTHPALALSADDPLALFAGRLHSSKGLDTLISGWETVAARRPTARLWIAGEGPEHDRLAALVQWRGLAASVVLTGAFDRIEDLLAAANLFVAPAVEEGTSLAVLEAMAAGLAVVATNIPGHCAFIDDQTHGRLVPPDDQGALAEAVLQLLDRPDVSQTYGAAARQRVGREFTLDRMVREHLTLFAALVARPAP